MAEFSKPARLLADGAVRPVNGPAWVFTVRGDHGDYVTVVTPTVFVCSCPAVGECAHITAARQFVVADDHTRAQLHTAIERAKDREGTRGLALIDALSGVSPAEPDDFLPRAGGLYGGGSV